MGVNHNTSLGHLVSKTMLAKIQQSYLNYLESFAAIVEADGSYIVARCVSKYCNFLSRASKNRADKKLQKAYVVPASGNCCESCRTAALKAIETDQPCEINCPGGMVVYAAPIIVDHLVIGSNYATISNPPTNEEELNLVAERFQVDPEKLSRVASAYTPRPDYLLKAARAHIDVAAKTIAEIYRGKLKELEIQSKSESQQTRLETQILEMKDYLESVITNAGDAIVTTNTKGIITGWNPAAEKIYGYSRNEAIGKHISMLTPPDRKHERQQLVMENKSHRTYQNFETVRLRKDGTRINISVTTSPIRDKEGRVIGDLGISRDITLQKQMEMELKQSEQKYKFLVDNSNEIVLILSRNGKIRFANKMAVNVSGYPEEEILGKSITHFLTKDSIPRALYAMAQEFLGRPQPVIEVRIKTKSGEMRDLEVAPGSNFIYEKGKLVGILINARDVTEWKRVEKALRESEHQYRTLQENVPVGLYRSTADARGKFLAANPALLRMFGFSSEEELQHISIIDLYQNPEDRDAFRKRLRKEGAVFNVELALRRKDGSPFWAEVSARATRNERGKIVYFDGMIEDVTERKRVQEEIQRRNKELAALNAIAETLNQSLDLDEMLPAALKKIVEVMEVTGGFICLIKGKDELQVTHSVGFSRAFLQDKNIRTGKVGEKGISGTVARTGQPKFLENLYEHILPEAETAARREGLQSAACVPLTSKDEILGVLFVADRHQRTFDPATRELLITIGKQIGVAIQNAWLYEQSKQDAEIKTVLLREMTHRVKNNLAAIAGLIYLELKNPVHISREEVLGELNQRIQSMASAYAMLSESKWVAAVDAHHLAQRIIYETAETIKPKDLQVEIQIHGNDAILNTKQATSLALVLNELTLNAVRHGLKNRSRGQLSVHTRLNRNRFQLTFADNGSGLPKDFDPDTAEGLGIMIIRTIVEKDLKGTFELRSSHRGTRAIISYPLPSETGKSS